MTESQFINWLKGFISGKQMLNASELAQLRATVQSLGAKQWTSSNTNESFPSSGKQMLHD